MPQPIAGVERIVAVGSGKGGVGKTTVTVNLALALALDGARVGVFDADVYGPNVPLMLGVHQTRVAEGFVAVYRRESTPYIPALERFGLKIMSIGLLVAEQQTVMPNPAFVASLVTQTLRDVLWGELDYLLIDLPPGTGQPQAGLVQTVRLDGVAIVTTPQDLSLLDAGRSLGLFRQAGVPILGVIENMSDLHCPHCGRRIEVFHHSDRRWALHDEELAVLGRIPMDLAISRGIDAGHPLMQASPTSREAMIFRDIAARIASKLAAE
jgi:ATP-binding protein involved in chromosome partitioning